MQRAYNNLRILAVMSTGLPGTLPEVWRGYGSLEAARTGALRALRDARVLGVAILDDHNGPLRLLEWMTQESQRETVTQQRSMRSLIETMQSAAAAGTRAPRDRQRSFE